MNLKKRIEILEQNQPSEEHERMILEWAIKLGYGKGEYVPRTPLKKREAES